MLAGVMAALDRRLGYQVINLGRGQPVQMADFVRLIEELVGAQAQLITPPPPASEPKVTYADISKARQLLGYDPKVSIHDGLARLWDWYRREVMPNISTG